MRIEHGIDRVVHLPPASAQVPELYQGAELSPASQGIKGWVDALYPARGIDAFLDRELDLQIDAQLLLAPGFNHWLDAAMQDLQALRAQGHPAEAVLTAALDVLQSQAQLRDLLEGCRNALLEA